MRELLFDESFGIGWFSAAYFGIIRGEPACFTKGLYNIDFIEFLRGLVNPIGRIKDDVTVDDGEFSELCGYFWFEFIDELFFIEHVGIGMEYEGCLGELWFRSFKDAFNKEVGDIIICQAFDDILHIFEDAIESGWVIECQEYCDVADGGFNIHTFGSTISYF